MSDDSNPANPAPDPPPPGSNPAQMAFGKYRARMAASPFAAPWVPAGWPAPPSTMPLGAPGGHNPLGGLGASLGGTARLSVDLLNATLYTAANALAGIGGRRPRDWACDDGWSRRDGCCGPDCCRQFGLECCRPGANGCGCGGGCGCG